MCREREREDRLQLTCSWIFFSLRFTWSQIPFVFANPVQDITPLGTDPARLSLGQLAARMWTSFVVDLDPNGHGGRCRLLTFFTFSFFFSPSL